MDPSGRYTTQQPIKIIEAYVAVKSVLLTQRKCRKDFGRNNVPDGRKIQRLVAKFRNSQKKWGRCSQRPRSFIVRHNSWGFQNLRERHEDFPRKSTRHLSQLAFREHPFLGSSMMILISFLTKFRSCRGKLIKVKRNEKHFMKISVKGLKMTLACWIWAIWTMLTTVAFVGDLLHLLTPEIWPPNVELSFYQVHCSYQNLSCIASVSEEVILWQSMPRWFLSVVA